MEKQRKVVEPCGGIRSLDFQKRSPAKLMVSSPQTEETLSPDPPKKLFLESHTANYPGAVSGHELVPFLQDLGVLDSALGAPIWVKIPGFGNPQGLFFLP